MLSESQGKRTEMFLLTLTLLCVSHNKRSATHKRAPPVGPLSISDRSLESVLQPCYPNTIRSREALNLFGFGVAIAQLGCKAAVLCEWDRLSVMKKGTF